ncbi:MAG TPA: L,D-transpeptidase family protein [Candidatus Sulfotelmatobacter sp.]|jgi:murein L,D-transpeptidase YcbB/YkuD
MRQNSIFQPTFRAPLSLLILALAAGLACASTPNSPNKAVPPQATDNVIRDMVASGKLDDLRWPSFPDYKGYLASFYESTGYRLAWIQAGKPTPQALSLIGLFKEAWKKGLEPEDYDASRWGNRLRAMQSSEADPARFDVALTVCTMRLVSDLRIGRINPQHFKFGLSVEHKKYDLAQFVRDRLLSASDLPAVVDGVEPPFTGYRRTQAALVRYAELAGRYEYEEPPTSPKPVDPGQTYAGVPRLARFLLLVGDLSPNATPPADSQTYDGALVEAVKHFQRRHGLKDDGRLGSDTLRQLNVPLSNRVLQLQLALERWRWLPLEFSAPPIVVNIPDFRLRALDENNRVTLDMRVVVGKSMPTQTPVFSQDMTYVVLRPYWNVPPSILRGEIVRAIQRDRNYIANKRYEVTTVNGTVVTSGSISDEVLADLKAGKLAVRQRPGPTNALGLVKLIFPNEFNVYLHSTPAPELFSRTRRDFSHGCIRVEKPAELTAWVLRNNSGWSVSRVKQAMEQGSDNVTVTLTQRVPVFIVYATALAYENGEVHFYDDIYGHDAKLAQVLSKGYPYP